MSHQVYDSAMTSPGKPLAGDGCDIIQGRVSTCLVDPPNRRQVVIYSCLDLSFEHARLAPGMSHQGCDRAMTSSVKPIANESCEIIKGRDLFLSRLVFSTRQTGARYELSGLRQSNDVIGKTHCK
uniref:Uncharacterized protein n=1 Tax=Timema monikensis TaxID=170555 RepID=A0A7R9HT45_9NEOP|nr:unnamed protein product [Timema monikensis]